MKIGQGSLEVVGLVVEIVILVLEKYKYKV